MSLFLRMLIAHILADFSLQSDDSVTCRKEKLWCSPHLYRHSFVYAILVGAASFAWNASWMTFFTIVAILFGSHVLIDGFKVRFTDRLGFFLIDQGLHLAILVAITAHLSPQGLRPFLEPIQSAFISENVLFILLGFLVVLWPTGVLISYLIRPFKEKIENGDNEKGGMGKAGLWIGFLERFLTYGFVISGHPQAIALLVAGKSVFRFGEIRKDNRAEVEYILIGSLFSFTSAMAVGQLVKMVIA